MWVFQIIYLIMPLDSGRKKDPAWLEVTPVENDKNKCVCKACDQVISKKIERIREHLSKCKVKNASHKEDECDELEKAAQSLLSPAADLPGRPESRMSLSSEFSEFSTSEIGSRCSTPAPAAAVKRIRSGTLSKSIIDLFLWG